MKYVSVFKRPGRLNWYVNYLDPETGKRRCNVRTEFPVADPTGYRKALDYANELSRSAKASVASGHRERWEEWVEAYLPEHYRVAGSLLKARQSWSQWRAFLHERKIHTPRGVDHAAVLAFIQWRTGQVKPSGRRVGRNTALTNVILMSAVMQEAVRRGYATHNPCLKTGLQWDDPREKPEITDAEIGKIRAGLADEPEWLRMTFEIAIHQGCRLSETRLHRSAVDFERGTITFRGKGNRVFATKLHPDLAPILKARFEANEWSIDPKLTVFDLSYSWWKFFRKVGLPHLSFHCTRVTVITRLARAGVPIQQAMAYVGHASTAIHRIYQRLKPADLGLATAAIRVP